MPLLGLRNDNKVPQVGLGLGLGSTLCYLYDCHLCGARVDSWGAHGLHCQKSLAGNDIKWSKPLAKVSAHLKPAGYINQFRRDQVDKPYGQGADKCYSSLKALRTASKIPKVLARQILTDPQSLEALQS